MDKEEREKYLESKISMENIIQGELDQLKNSSKVYHKQHNSDIFFLSSVDQELRGSQCELKKLITEMDALKKSMNKS